MRHRNGSPKNGIHGCSLLCPVSATTPSARGHQWRFPARRLGGGVWFWPLPEAACRIDSLGRVVVFARSFAFPATHRSAFSVEACLALPHCANPGGDNKAHRHTYGVLCANSCASRGIRRTSAVGLTGCFYESPAHSPVAHNAGGRRQNNSANWR